MSKKWAYFLAFIWAFNLLLNASMGNSLLAILNLITVIIYALIPIILLVASIKEIRNRRKKYDVFKGNVKAGRVNDFEDNAKEVIK